MLNIRIDTKNMICYSASVKQYQILRLYSMYLEISFVEVKVVLQEML